MYWGEHPNLCVPVPHPLWWSVLNYIQASSTWVVRSSCGANIKRISSPQSTTDLWNQGETRASPHGFCLFCLGSQLLMLHKLFFHRIFVFTSVWSLTWSLLTEQGAHSVFPVNKQFTSSPLTLGGKLWLPVHLPGRFPLIYPLLSLVIGWRWTWLCAEFLSPLFPQGLVHKRLLKPAEWLRDQGVDCLVRDHWRSASSRGEISVVIFLPVHFSVLEQMWVVFCFFLPSKRIFQYIIMHHLPPKPWGTI